MFTKNITYSGKHVVIIIATRPTIINGIDSFTVSPYPAPVILVPTNVQRAKGGVMNPTLILTKRMAPK